jgi:predicted metal-dependent RNase
VLSRYAAATHANRKQLLLYFKIGKLISDKIKAQKGEQKCVTKFRQTYKRAARLKEYSPGNIKKIRIFAEAYSAHLTIGSRASN